jgi:hypothetical protein
VSGRIFDRSMTATRRVCALLVIGCQRLEVVTEEPHYDVESSSDGSDSSSGDELSRPDTVCVREASCECYGASENQFCDMVVRDRCGGDPSCGTLGRVAWESCIVDDRCENGGHIEGDVVVCDGVPSCAGPCDLDPSRCDRDHDGVAIFPCGPNGLACALGQWCVEVDACSSQWQCTDPPADCRDDDVAAQSECVHDQLCPASVGIYVGHVIYCYDDAC